MILSLLRLTCGFKLHLKLGGNRQKWPEPKSPAQMLQDAVLILLKYPDIIISVVQGIVLLESSERYRVSPRYVSLIDPYRLRPHVYAKRPQSL